MVWGYYSILPLVSANIPDSYIIGDIFLVMPDTLLKVVTLAPGVLVDVLLINSRSSEEFLCISEPNFSTQRVEI